MVSSIATDASRRLSSLSMQLGDRVLNEHDVITVDGSTGEIYLGAVERRSAAEDEDFQAVLKWADELRTLKVRRCMPCLPCRGGEGL